MNTTILIDGGHGVDTNGKMSPNGLLREWHYCRQVAKEVEKQLKKRGYEVVLVTPESRDVALSERVARVNAIARRKPCILISIHLNAAGDGSKWLNASGWECYTSKGETMSDVLAEELCKAAKDCLKGFNLRTDNSDGDSDKEANFYILKNTICPAVLTENLFMDSKKDYDFLLSDAGFEAIVKLHVQGIVNYLNAKK